MPKIMKKTKEKRKKRTIMLKTIRPLYLVRLLQTIQCSRNARAPIRLIMWFLCVVQDAQCNTEESPHSIMGQRIPRVGMHYGLFEVWPSFLSRSTLGKYTLLSGGKYLKILDIINQTQPVQISLTRRVNSNDFFLRSN